MVLGSTLGQFCAMLRPSWGYLGRTRALLGSTLGFMSLAKWKTIMLHMFYVFVCMFALEAEALQRGEHRFYTGVIIVVGHANLVF